MQEHVYRAKRSKILGQSVFIWLFVLLQVFTNIYLAETAVSRGEYWVLLLMNLILAVINIPALVLFFRYYKHSIGKEFIVSYHTLRLCNARSGDCITINSSDIKEIKLVQNIRMSRLPWAFHEYFSINDAAGKEIVVTSYVMELHELWLDPLARRIDMGKLVKEERYYPVF